MVPILLAAALAGSVLATAETAYIILSCGPFWLRPWVILLTSLIYACATLCGLCLVYGPLRLFPPLRRFFANPLHVYFPALLAAWPVGAFLLAALIRRDLDGGRAYLGFALLATLLGTLATWVARLLIPRPAHLPRRGLFLTVMILFLGVTLLWVADASYGAATRRRTAHCDGLIRSICLVVLDTVRGDHLSCNGYPKPTTPNIDAVAAEGLHCINAFSASNWTPPGHVSIFTGMYPSQHGNDGKAYTPDHLLTMTEILNHHGHYSIALYNNHLAGRTTNLTQGFDIDIGVYRHSWVYPAWHRLWGKLVRKDSGARPTFFMALQTIRWMAARNRPLFLYLNLLEPHAEYAIHEPFFTELLGAETLAAIPNLAEVDRLRRSRKQVIYDPERFANYNAASFAYLTAAYDSEVAYLDQQFGRLIAGLREAGLLDEVLLVVTADHGEFLGERFTRGHPRLLFDPVLRIPLIMRYPQRIPPQVMEPIVSNVDILPTVLSLAGYVNPLAERVQGIDLFHDPRLGNRLLLSEHIKPDGGCYSLYDGAYKLIINDDEGILERTPYDTLLFAYPEDTREIEDLRRRLPDRSAQMSRDLGEWESRIRIRPDEEIELSEETIAKLRALGYIQ